MRQCRYKICTRHRRRAQRRQMPGILLAVDLRHAMVQAKGDQRTECNFRAVAAFAEHGFTEDRLPQPDQALMVPSTTACRSLPKARTSSITALLRRTSQL